MIVIKRRKRTIRLRITKQQADSYWDSINGGKESCFVCSRKFKDKDKGTKVTVGYHKHTGEVLIRHIKCESGSVQWNKKFVGCFDEFLKPIERRSK